MLWQNCISGGMRENSLDEVERDGWFCKASWLIDKKIEMQLSKSVKSNREGISGACQFGIGERKSQRAGRFPVQKK